jgi:DNA-binding MarR family transcriptional regulator
MNDKRNGDEVVRAASEATRCIALRARRLSRLVTKLFEDGLRDQAITVAQFTLLGATVLEGPLQPARLARMLDLEKSTLSRNLALLEAAGLVRVDRSGAGAGCRITATKRGRRVLLDALPAWREAQEQAIAAIGGSAVDRLDAMIGALGGEAAGSIRRRDG